MNTYLPRVVQWNPVSNYGTLDNINLSLNLFVNVMFPHMIERIHDDLE